MWAIPTDRSPDTDYGVNACLVTPDGDDHYYSNVYDSYGNYGYNTSFRNVYSTNPSKSITAKLMSGGFALRILVVLTCFG